MLKKRLQVKSKKTVVSVLITLYLTTSVNIVFAEEIKIDEDKKLPDFLSQERKLSEKDLKKKKTGVFFTGLPSFTSDPLNGFGFGATGYIFFNGEKTDKLFPYTPYFLRTGLTLKQSTGNSQEFRLKMDAPYILETPWRFKLDAVYGSSPNNLYFGLTEKTFEPLPQGTYDNYAKTLGTIRKGVQGEANEVADVLKHKFLEREWMINLKGERVLFDGNWRFITGYELQHLSYKTFENEMVEALDTTTGKTRSVPNGKSLVQQDAEKSKLFGVNGGFVSLIQGALIYDTRDFEPDPSKGLVAELGTEFSAPAIGSNFFFNKFLLQVKNYYKVLPEIFPRTVLATRFGYGTIIGDQAPFFEYQDQWSPDGSIKALGGSQTLRGYKENRFLGRTVAYTNIELRHRVGEVDLIGQNLNFTVAPFVDLGTVGDKEFLVNLSQIKASTGVSFRLGWNLSTLLTLDFALSPEDKQVFLNFNNSF